jgi:hypothetical protein
MNTLLTATKHQGHGYTLNRKTKNISRVFYALIAALLVCTPAAKAQYDWNNSTLYAIDINGVVYAINNPSTNSPTHTRIMDVGSQTTMAIGPDIIGGDMNSLVAYFWTWDWGGGGTVTRVTSTNARTTFTVPRPNSAYNYWSGGEVNQQTGEIYFTSGELDEISATQSSNRFRIMRYNPLTGNYVMGRLVPAPGETARNGYIYSDMAVDADGNVYIISRSTTNANQQYLLKVNVTSVLDNGLKDWTYSTVAKLNGYSDALNGWGMAFHQGKLYFQREVYALYEMDPLTGNVTNRTRPTPGQNIFDLATAQTATLIKGKVFNDANGNGIIEATETAGVPGINITVKEGGTTLPTNITTNASGEYSLIVPKSNATYDIILSSPKINGVHAVQTWASAGQASNGSSSYKTTAYTTDGITSAIEVHSDSAVYGTSIPNAIYHSQVVMAGAGTMVGIANFGITTQSDLGDAAGHSPNSAGHIVTDQKWLYMGNDVSAESTAKAADDYDDGVTVFYKGSWVPLQDVTFNSGSTYNFRVHTNGPLRAKGYLSAWVGYSTAGVIENSAMPNRIAANLSPNATGLIEFSYTFPPMTNPATSNTPFAVFMRFRFSETTDLPAIDVLANPNKGIYGEVEDYRVYMQRLLFSLEDKYATVQAYTSSVEISVPEDGVFPSTFFNGSFSLADSLIQPPVAGRLSYTGSNANSKVIYSHDGHAPLVNGIDSFKFSMKYYDPVSHLLLQETATVYVFILQPNTISSFAACYGSNGRIGLLKAQPSYNFYWYDDLAGTSEFGTNPRDHSDYVNQTTDLNYYVRPEVTGYPFPIAKIVVPVIGSTSNHARMRWTGLLNRDWFNARNWVEVKIDNAGNEYETPVLFAPVGCVDVVISSGSLNFPELNGLPKTIHSGNITIKDRAMIKNTQALDYDTAKVELKLRPSERDRFVMWSAPLMNMYSGDYHFKDKLGVPQWGDVYMSYFQRANPAGGVAAENTLTATFGQIGEHLELGKAFNLKVATTSESKNKTWFFPQPGSYPDKDGTLFNPVRTFAGKFITDTVGRDFDLPLVDNTGMKFVQVVNPFLAYLDFTALRAANPIIAAGGYYIWDGDIKSGFTAVYVNGNRFEITTPGFDSNPNLIEPLQSFIVAKQGGSTANVNSLHISTSSMSTTTGKNPYSLRSEQVQSGGVLHIKASQGSSTGFAALVYEPEASPAKEDKDMPVLVYDEIPLTVYTLTRQSEALAINASNDFEWQDTDLGLRLKDAGETKLEFINLQTFGHNVFLIDKLQNKTINLQESPEYTFTVAKTGANAIELNDRFSLRTKYTGQGITTGNETIASSALRLSSDAGYLHIQSTKEPVGSLQIYNTTGALVYSGNTPSTHFSIPVAGGQMYIVKAHLGKEILTEKFVVK